MQRCVWDHKHPVQSLPAHYCQFCVMSDCANLRWYESRLITVRSVHSNWILPPVHCLNLTKNYQRCNIWQWKLSNNVSIWFSWNIVNKLILAAHILTIHRDKLTDQSDIVAWKGNFRLVHIDVHCSRLTISCSKDLQSRLQRQGPSITYYHVRIRWKPWALVGNQLCHKVEKECDAMPFQCDVRLANQ